MDMSGRLYLLRIWYGIVILILVALLYEHTAKLELGSIAFWIRLVFLLAFLVLTFYVIDDLLMPERSARRVERILSKELLRKSRQIKKLKEEKAILFNSALKREMDSAAIRKK